MALTEPEPPGAGPTILRQTDNDKHALDPAAAVEARRDYRALRKSGSPDGGTQRTNQMIVTLKC